MFLAAVTPGFAQGDLFAPPPLKAPGGWGDEAPPLAEPMDSRSPSEPEAAPPPEPRERPSGERPLVAEEVSRPRDGGGPRTPENLAESAEMEGDTREKPAEPEGPPIAAIEVLGNRLISSDVIMLSLEGKVGDRVKDSLIERDVQALQQLGYFAYVEPEVIPTEDGQVSILYKVVENPVLREVKVEGATLIPVEELQENIVVEPGNVLNVTQLKESLSRLNKVYQEKDYFFCGVLSPDQFDMDRNTGILTIRVAEPVLGEVRITGNDKTRSHVILRQMEVRRGRILRAEGLRRSIKNLVRLNYFDEVKPPHPVLSEDLSVVDLEIEVNEARTGQASAGGGYSSLNGVIGFIDVAERNFRGRGQTVRVKWEFGGQKSYQLDFVEPWLRGKPQSLGLSLFSTRVNRAQFFNSIQTNLYEERRTGYAISTSRRVAKDTRLTLSFSNEKVEANSSIGQPLPIDLAVRDLDGDGRVSFDQQFVTLGWIKDARDNPINANEGYRYSASVSTTGGALKGPAGFNRYVFDARKYFPIGRRNEKTGRSPWTFATRTRYGFHSVFEGALTFNDRFAVGGSDSIRGYEDREFTGERFGMANLELRKHISKVMSAVLFYDIGDAWGSFGQDRDLKGGYGLGLRLTTPIGPFRLDYGRGEDRGGRFHFGIGQQF